MRNSWNAIQVALALSLGASMPALAASYRYTDIVVPGATITGLGGISHADTVVGTAFMPNGSPQYQGFVWNRGIVTLVPGSAGLSAIENDGLMAAGPAADSDNQNGVYVTYDIASGAITTVNTGLDASLAVRGMGYNDTVFAIGVKNGPRVVNFSYKRRVIKYKVPGTQECDMFYANAMGNLVLNCYLAHPDQEVYYLYEGGDYTPITVPGQESTTAWFITETGQVGGSTTGPGHPNGIGFVLSGGVYTTYAGPSGNLTSAVFGIGPSGQILGIYEDGNKNDQTYIFANNTYSTLTVPGAVSTVIQSVSTSGTLLGNWYDAQYTPHPFIAKCPKGEVCTSITK